MTGRKISSRVAEQLKSDHRKLGQIHPGVDGARLPNRSLEHRRQAILQEALPVSPDRLTDRPTAMAKPLVRGSDGDLYFEKKADGTDLEVEVANPFEEIGFADGLYIKIEWIDGEWQPYAADCEG